MPPNLRKSQPNLSKPSEGGSFSAAKKPAETTNPLRNGLNLTGERELGTVGGVKSTARLTVGVDNLIGQQGLDIEIDATNRTVGFGAGIGSTRGKLGVNIGGKVGYDEEGKISIKGAEAGINIGGFGGSASIDEDEGIRGSVSVAGAKVEIGISPDGKKNLSLCYGVPGGELCATFEPDPGIETPSPLPPGTPIPLIPSPGSFSPPLFPSGGSNNCLMVIAITNQIWWLGVNPFYRSAISQGTCENGVNIKGSTQVNGVVDGISYDFTTIHNNERMNSYSNGNFTDVGGLGGFFYVSGPESIVYERIKQEGWFYKEDGPLYIHIRTATIIHSSCSKGADPSPSSSSPSSSNKIQLPNYPQHFKAMDCCDKVEEIYKFLGIAKLKKKKFPVSNAFLVPGGTGNDNCFDYYAIMQALFRMLANGLIINPKSKPLGSEWQNVNATAWASGMYEMMAESMSDGNSTQRFEVATIMQLTQMMATLAENGRKIEFVADAIGIEPLPVAENLPVCFTIYEGHKGFGKKEPKKINVSGLKTDSDVENALGKMLSPSLIPITAWKFRPGQISIKEALRNG